MRMKAALIVLIACTVVHVCTGVSNWRYPSQCAKYTQCSYSECKSQRKYNPRAGRETYWCYKCKLNGKDCERRRLRAQGSWFDEEEELYSNRRSLRSPYERVGRLHDSMEENQFHASSLYHPVKKFLGFDLAPTRKCNDATKRNLIASFSPVLQERMRELENIQPKCSAMRFVVLCNECAHFMNDNKFAQCMLGRSINETPEMKRICLMELAEKIGEYRKK